MKWEKASIKDICLGIYDGPHATPPLSDTGGIFLGIPNFVNGRLNLNNVRYISEKDLPKWTKRVTPKENDIVFSYEATLNLYAIIPEGFYGCLGRRMGLLRVDNSKVFYKFLYYYFFSERWQRVIKENTVLGSTVDRLPLIKFPDFPVFLPSLQTQYKIASILSAYDDLIENNQKQIKLLEEAAQRLYKEWFVDLCFPGHEGVKVVDGVPEGWESCKLRDVAEINGRNIGENYPYDKINYIDIGSVRNGRILEKANYNLEEAPGRAKRIVQDGDVIWGMVRPNLRAYAMVLNPDKNDVFSTGFAVLTSKKVPFSFLYCNVTTEEFVGYLVNCTNGAAYPAVKPIHFEEYNVSIPQNNLLNKFHNITEPYFRKIYYLNKQISSLREARDRLLPKLMSGEIEV